MISAALSATDVTKREESAALRDSSPVVAICSSIALAIAANTGRIAAIAVMIRFTAAIDSCASRCNWSILRPISSVAFCVALDSAFTSFATTAKPRPGIACAHRLDRGVERQQIGLLGDRRDQAHDVADLGR